MKFTRLSVALLVACGGSYGIDLGGEDGGAIDVKGAVALSSADTTALQSCVSAYVDCVDANGADCRTPLGSCVRARLAIVAAKNDAGVAGGDAEAALARAVDDAAMNACLDQAEACYRESKTMDSCVSPAWRCLSTAFTTAEP